MALLYDALAPVVAFKRAVHRQAHGGDAGQSGEAVFDLAVEGWEPVQRVTSAGRVKVHDVSIRRGHSKILVLKMREGFGHQDGMRKNVSFAIST